MANYFCIFPAPDSHIDFITKYPETLFDYMSGQCPTFAARAAVRAASRQATVGNTHRPPLAVEFPEDWPDSEVNLIGPRIRDCEVDLFHLILNGTTDGVTGSGSMFQTWMPTRFYGSHSAIGIAGKAGAFAFHAHQLPELLELFVSLDAGRVESGLTRWLANGTKQTTMSTETPRMWSQALTIELAQFAEAIREAISKSRGLIWVMG